MLKISLLNKMVASSNELPMTIQLLGVIEVASLHFQRLCLIYPELRQSNYDGSKSLQAYHAEL